MRALLLAAGCLFFVGCTFGANTCKIATDCKGGSVCDPSGFCVEPDSGMGGGGGGTVIGGGGGTTTGGGGGAIGGGGGSTGGGGGAVGPEACLNVSCDAGFECQVGATDAGQCSFSYAGLLLSEPSDAGPYGGSQANINVLATLQLVSGHVGQNPPATIDVEFASTALTTVRTLTWNGAAYEGIVGAGGLQNGDYVVKASYDAGLPNILVSNALAVRVDNAGPRISIAPWDGGLGPYKRDELVMFVVSADDALSQSTLTFDGRQQTETTCPASTCTPDSRCRCFNVDMSEPPLPAMDGGFLLGAVAQDLLSNATVTMDGGTANITRLRWTVALPGNLAVRAAPALGVDGTLYLGTASGNLADRIFALSPSGTVKSGWPVGGVDVGAVQGLALGDQPGGEVVFYSANTVLAGVIGGLAASDGGVLNASNPCNEINGTTYSGIGLIQAGVLRAVGVIDVAEPLLDGGLDWGRPCAFRTGGADVSGPETASLRAPEVPTPFASATNVAVDSSSSTVYFIGRGGRVITTTFNGAWGSPVTAQLGGASVGALFSGGALFKDSLGVAALAVGSASTPGDLYTLSSDGGFAPKVVGGSSVGFPTVLSTPGPTAAFFYAGIGTPTSVDRFQYSQPNSTPGPQTSARVTTAPVLGEGGLGYAVANNGQLTVFSTTTFSSSREWSAPLPTTAVAASPTLDCVRDSSGVGVISRVGVLYVASTNGNVTAVLVDSPKLNTTVNSWPKYQRTAGNSGNTAFALNPGCP